METLHPGIFFDEVVASSDGSSVKVTAPVKQTYGAKAIVDAPTSISAFVGIAPRGKVGQAVLVSNWTQYVNEFGAFTNDSYLAYAVKGFFENGGRQAYIVRAVHYNTGVKTSAIATLALEDAVATDVITINAKNDGVWGNDISVEVTNVVSSTFTVNVYYKGILAETFKNTTLATFGDDATLNSKLINATVIGTTVPKVVAKTALTGGVDGTSGMVDEDYVGDESVGNGLQALVRKKVNLVAVPGVTTQVVHAGLIAFASANRSIAILDAPMSMTSTQVATYITGTLKPSSARASMYFPFLTVSDPIGVGKKPTKNVPPCGHVMGTVARADASIGVWRAPAGTDAKVFGILGLAQPVFDGEQDDLNPINVNCIRTFDGDGTMIWGTRVFSTADFQYIPNRRLVDFIEDSLANNMRWTNFKPNDENLWSLIEFNTEQFLAKLWSKGALKGETAEEAFYVKCDEENNSDVTVDLGQTICDIGIAMHKPNEFTIFRLNLRK